MSAAEERRENHDALPTFDLAYGLDDAEEPTEVTVYWPEAEDVSTAWLSVDARHAVSLDEIA